MTTLRHARIREIFDEAAILSRKEREQFVKRACSGDSALKAELLALLDALDGAGEFLESPTIDDTEGSNRIENDNASRVTGI